MREPDPNSPYWQDGGVSIRPAGGMRHAAWGPGTFVPPTPAEACLFVIWAVKNGGQSK